MLVFHRARRFQRPQGFYHPPDFHWLQGFYHPLDCHWPQGFYHPPDFHWPQGFYHPLDFTGRKHLYIFFSAYIFDYFSTFFIKCAPIF
jgi:hypothetical protein